MWYLLLIIPVIVVIGIVIAASKKQADVTKSYSEADSAQDQRLVEESKKILEATVTEKLAEKARDPRLASMTQTDLVYEVLKDCHDPEIPLNIVDLGLVYGVQLANDASVVVQMTMTSPMCLSHVAISEDVKTKLADAGFQSPKVEIIWEPAWSPQRISEEGKKKLGLA